MTFGFPRGYDIEKTAANAFPRAAFDTIEFVYHELSVKGGIRHHLHEFPHSPGAEVEKLGRKAYVITFTSHFHNLPGSELDKQYPELYPTRLRQLRELFEKEKTAELVVPTIGTISAVATSWTQSFSASKPTGESVTLEFVEDQEARAFDDQTTDYGAAQISAVNDQLLAAAALAEFNAAATQSFFQDLNDAITAFQAVASAPDMMARVVEGKLRAIENLCIWGDSQLADLQKPENFLVVQALQDLWLSTKKLANNVVQTRGQLLRYRVPKVMTVGQVSTALYGSSERAVEILQLNAFEDALAIQAGTTVVYAAA